MPKPLVGIVAVRAARKGIKSFIKKYKKAKKPTLAVGPTVAYNMTVKGQKDQIEVVPPENRQQYNEQRLEFYRQWKKNKVYQDTKKRIEREIKREKKQKKR